MVTNREQDTDTAGAGKNFNVRMPEERISELDQLAEHGGRSRNWVINEAVRLYLEARRQWNAEIAQRVAEIERGEAELIAHEVVVNRQRERLKAKLGLV